MTLQALEPASARVVRTGSDIARRRSAPYRVVAHGLTYFCQKLPGLFNDREWDVQDRSQHDVPGMLRLVRDLRTCDLAFSWGGRLDMGPFLRAAKLLATPNVVLFWCGSDVLRAAEILKRRSADDWILRQIHWAASPSLTEEVRALGVNCEYVQASFVPALANPAPLPENFSVTVFLPTPRLAHLYGWDVISEVAAALPHIAFNLVGLREGTLEVPANVRVHRWIDDLSPVYRESTVLWRPVRHDAGIAFMVLEALSHGRHVLYTYPVPGAVRVEGTAETLRQLQHLFDLHRKRSLPLNRAGIEAIARIYSRDVVRADLRRRWADIIAQGSARRVAS